ncbi:MAG: type II toxin-antitoxin system HicA family toxin [Candidatus Altarchaeum sp.]|nr:type II toxin-antitoxin system HicA family toxin [Candidatus Altarchaeum sp.]
MSKLPILNYTQLIKKVKKASFVFERQGKRSHEFWVNYETKRIIMVPRHPQKTIPIGILKSIIKESGLTVDELLKL